MTNPTSTSCAGRHQTRFLGMCVELYTVSTPKTIMFSFGKPERGNQQMCQQKPLDWFCWPFEAGRCGVESDSRLPKGGKIQSIAILWCNELEVRRVYTGDGEKNRDFEVMSDWHYEKAAVEHPSSMGLTPFSSFSQSQVIFGIFLLVQFTNNIISLHSHSQESLERTARPPTHLHKLTQQN